MRLLADAGLPLPRCQVVMRPWGGAVMRVDLAWEGHRLVVELDGHATHATRHQRRADAERDARLALAGWRVLRFTYEDVTRRPAYVVTTVERHLADRRAA
jgi:very-short-patch-repair endonuclease